MSVLVTIESPTFRATAQLHNGKVTRADPILEDMMGWDLPRVQNYAKMRRWKIECQAQEGK